MHFSIPDTQELYADKTGTTYTAYNIYINGSYHAYLRYKQLHALHEQLRCMEMGLEIPNFPPKKLLPLTSNQVETRRAALERYLQLIGQDNRIAKLELFQHFLLRAQLETASAENVLEEWFGYGTDGGDGHGEEDYMRPVTLDILLPNHYKLHVDCCVSDNSSTLLAKSLNLLHLQANLMPYFCLFLIRRDSNNTLVLLRKLMDFEAPFVSRLHMDPCQIQIRKSYWNPNYDKYLFNDATALNLLFMQTIAEVESEWILTTNKTLQELQLLQEQGLKHDYIEMVRKLPLYGCLQFLTAQVDYPEPDTSALIAIGNKELSLRTFKSDKIYETKFRVTRMRCWRVTAVYNTHESKDKSHNLQLSFEYLMSKENLRWITINSPQAMLMSVCLQSMVDELLNYKDNEELTLNNTADFNYSHSLACNNHNIHRGSSLSSLLTSSSYVTWPSMTTTTVSATTVTSTTTKAINATTAGHNKEVSVTPISPASSSSTASYSSYSLATASTPSNSPSAPVKFLQQRFFLNKSNPKLTNPQYSYDAVFFRNSSSSHHHYQQQQNAVKNEAFDNIIGDDDL